MTCTQPPQPADIIKTGYYNWCVHDHLAYSFSFYKSRRGLKFPTTLTPKTVALSQMTPYCLHSTLLLTIRHWSKYVHDVGNRVPLGHRQQVFHGCNIL